MSLLQFYSSAVLSLVKVSKNISGRYAEMHSLTACKFIGLYVKRGNIPLVENPYVISAWAACFSPPFVCYYSSILDIMYSWPIDSYQWSINLFYVY